MNSKQIVEIKGVKMEVDFREGTSTRVENFKVGDRVKVLTKGYDSYNVRPGVIIGFDEFKALPTIKIMAVSPGYGGSVEYINFNEGLKEAEIIAANDDEELFAKREDVVATLNRTIEQKRIELETAQHNLRTFERYFGAAIEKAEATSE